MEFGASEGLFSNLLDYHIRMKGAYVQTILVRHLNFHGAAIATYGSTLRVIELLGMSNTQTQLFQIVSTCSVHDS